MREVPTPYRHTEDVSTEGEVRLDGPLSVRRREGNTKLKIFKGTNPRPNDEGILLKERIKVEYLKPSFVREEDILRGAVLSTGATRRDSNYLMVLPRYDIRE